MKLVATKIAHRVSSSYVEEYTVMQEKTLRDEFAMAALQGLYSSEYCEQSYEALAEMAYRQADAMLIMRKRKLDD